MNADPSIAVYLDREALSHAAAARLAEIVEERLSAQSRVTLVLAGGGTPRRLYELLAETYRLPWDRIYVFWGDERFVPADHPASNYRMAYDALFRHLPAAPPHLYPIPTDTASPQEAATAYEATLRRFFPDLQSAFDVTLLGLGDDGHTASLFPENKPQTRQTGGLVEAVTAPPRYAVRPRITLTLPALNASRRVFFLVSGAGKRDALHTVLHDPRTTLPAAYVRAREQLTWFVDEEAYRADGQIGR